MSPHSRRFTLQSLALAVAVVALPAQAYIDAPSQARAAEHAERGRGATDKTDKADKADKSNNGSAARANGNAPLAAKAPVPTAAAAVRK